MMKEDVNLPPSRSQPERPTTSALKQRSAEAIPRDIDSRASSLSNTPVSNARPVPPGVRLTSLSALYKPAFKPYAFSHMYNTKYSNDFQGTYAAPPSPLRPESTNYATIDYNFTTTMYNQHFQKPKPMPLAFVVPYSRHRHNNPQPRMANNYNYPDSSRWIWSSPSALQGSRETHSSQGPQGWNSNTRIPYPRHHRWCSR
ncbi:uncharacterized protein LOC116290641 [Actinia tenebrosa]|uniref:Uncharacterized protein LOC116290641 n=1 Tax=Actinia tenebrosa TaxID=6105 RepID=A0A6P8HEZ8_ACTTE|nr:uncharacterized protein LOC116290641 [Actinia tenebrosa]